MKMSGAIADPVHSQIHPFILKAWYNLHDSLSVVSLPARYDFKWLKNQAAELCRIHFYSANVDELHAQDLSMASAVIQQRDCQCNLPVFGFRTRKMLNTQTAVVFGMVYDFLPFMILPIYNSMARIKNDVIERKKTLVQVTPSFYSRSSFR